MFKIFIISVFFVFNISSTLHSQWLYAGYGINAPSSNAKSLVANGGNIFAGIENYPSGYGAVYLTTNNGLNWNNTGLNGNPSVNSLVTGNSNVYAGTDIGVYFTTTNGQNWTQAGALPYAHCLAVSGSTVFAGSSGVYLTTNNGQNWTLTGLVGITVYSLVINGSTIFAGTYNNGVYRSTDNGSNWTNVGLTLLNIRSIVINGSNVFAGTYGNNGVYRSTNNGNNWTQTSLNNRSILSLAISGTNIIAGSDTSGVYVSTDNGINWVQKNEGMNARRINAILLTPNYIYAGTDPNGGNLYRRISAEIIGIEMINSIMPKSYSLSQNYPNPFNPVTQIEFDITKQTFTKLTVYNSIGIEVSVLVNKELKTGKYRVDFDGSNLSSGVYFYRLETEDFSNTKKMIILR